MAFLFPLGAVVSGTLPLDRLAVTQYTAIMRSSAADPCSCTYQSLNGHCVIMQVSGQVLLPGAAMLEAALSCAALLLEKATLGSPVTPLLSGISIPAPLQLSARSATVLECLVTDLSSSAAVSIQSGGLEGSRPAAVHLRGGLIGAIEPTAVQKPLFPHQPACHAAITAAAAAHASRGPQPGAHAALNTAQNPPGGGYRAHPAVTDASLHLGAYLGTVPDQAAQHGSVAAAVRVPSALAAFWASKGATQGECQAAVGDLSQQPGDSALSSYWLPSGTATTAGAVLQGLLATPVKRGAAAVAALPQAAAQRSSMLYSLRWAASEAALSAAAASRSMRATLTWRIASREVWTLPARQGSLGAKALQGSAGSLGLLQQVLTTQKPSGAQLQHGAADAEGVTGRSGMPNSLQHALEAAGASGLLRTAAQEYPAMQWQARGSSLLSVPSKPHAEPQDADAFGTRLAESVITRPQLLSAAPEEESSTLPEAVLHGSLAITGGLGGIGLLAGLWAAQQHSGVHVHLLGRTGHAGLNALPALAHMPHVTLTRCDAGSREEAAQLARSAGMLRQIWHAGGLLQDATLPVQTLGSLRTVAAPKLDGMLSVAAAAAQLPVASVALFSSTAALLGPPGQGNYAAANAQLSAWAQAMQGAGKRLSFLFSNAVKL